MCVGLEIFTRKREKMRQGGGKKWQSFSRNLTAAAGNIIIIRTLTWNEIFFFFAVLLLRLPPAADGGGGGGGGQEKDVCVIFLTILSLRHTTQTHIDTHTPHTHTHTPPKKIITILGNFAHIEQKDTHNKSITKYCLLIYSQGGAGGNPTQAQAQAEAPKKIMCRVGWRISGVVLGGSCISLMCWRFLFIYFFNTFFHFLFFSLFLLHSWR